MLTAGPGKGARWTGEASRAACAHQTAPTSPGKDRSAARMERPTKTNARCWRRNVKATPTWTCSTRESARVRKSLNVCQESCSLLCFFLHFASCFTKISPFPLSRQKRAVTSCAPAAPHASWTRQITHIVWRVIGFAPRWRRPSSTCVETTGSSTPAPVTWEELPVSSADPLEWHMRENASVSLQLETWESVRVYSLGAPPATDFEYCLSAFYSSSSFCQHSTKKGVLERERVCVW